MRKRKVSAVSPKYLTLSIRIENFMKIFLNYKRDFLRKVAAKI